eukprot:gnl/TRDRNA2_/TRDRNA2_129302_c0_seq1.p1 gnl/TRDRNA2_/TRDRNA2_129302_c0~~gnl/TRDRNA2_/TRDRNA2_129302_c0_seq1.p1  ORF type:complete len:288 (-),score=87.39 gnl/TRDRNA2_/TRDRNA2_129302_c0_seq1:51-914(-)
MPIVTLPDWKDDGGGFDGGGEKVDGEKLSPFGPGGIYHEKQVGALCAVHCLNNLMQGPMFDEVTMAEVARDLDAQERRLLGGAALAGGGNVREDGFFNLPVISAVLQRAGFEMERMAGAAAQAAIKEPAKQRGFICNKKEHWFAFRRIGQEWFDLNSCLKTPRHFTDAELAQHVNEALNEGYTVFNVRGEYQRTELDANSKKLLEAVQGCGHFRQTHCLFSGEGQTLGGGSGSAAAPQVDPDLLAAAESDPELAAAIQASLAEQAKPAPSAEESKEEMRRKRLARFG